MRKLSLLLLAVTSIVFFGCGGGNAIQVGDVEISQDSFDRWVETTSRTMQGGKGDGPFTPDAPDFTDCINQKKKVAKGTQPPSDEALKSLCQSFYNTARQETLKNLALQAWIIAQAQKQNLRVSDQQVDQQVKSLKQQMGDNAEGINQDDLRMQAKEILFTQILRQRAETQKIPTPSEEQLQAYYAKNIQQFNRLPSRDLFILVANSKAKADLAVAALKKGQSWAQVYRRYNNTQSWGASKPLQISATPPSFQPVLAKQLFSAPVGPVRGPISVPGYNNGWAVFQIKNSTPGVKAQPFNMIRKEVLKNYLSNQRIRSADNVLLGLSKTWQKETECADDLKQFYPCAGTKPPGAKK